MCLSPFGGKSVKKLRDKSFSFAINYWERTALSTKDESQNCVKHNGISGDMTWVRTNKTKKKQPNWIEPV